MSTLGMSPGVTVKEEVLTTFVESSAQTGGALVGDFAWGPCEPLLITNENELVNTYGKPNNTNYKDWFTAANFLNYSKKLNSLRVVNEATKNAADVTVDAIQIKSESDFSAMEGTLSGSGKTAKIYARYPGLIGNELKVVIADKTALNESNVLLPYINQIIGENDVAVGVFHNDKLVEMNVYSFDKNSKNINGETNYVITAVNKFSNYIYLIESKLITYSGDLRASVNINTKLTGGTYTQPIAGDYTNGWNLFKDPSAVDVSLLMQGGGDATVGKYIVESVAGVRKDCIACVSPQQIDVLNTLQNSDLSKLIAASVALGMNTFKFMDGNYKYQYDSYNDVYRWVPLNGDIAGVFAETDSEHGAWFSPGGRKIKNVVKLAFYPTNAQRDLLFKNKINPVTSFTDTGPVLYGDWTGADANSPFNFVSIRRLFIYMEKQISTFARPIMWKQNDETTQSMFYQSVDPFLRNIKGSRGISDYKIICNDTVNTVDVKSSGKFIAKIYVIPVYSIRGIEITFVSSRTGTMFDEIAQS